MPTIRLIVYDPPQDGCLTQHSLPGGLLGLTWAGLTPADRASFAGAFL